MEIQRGTCYALFAYDVSLSIDLDACERRITAAQRETLRHKRRAPRDFEYHPAPLRVTEYADGIGLGTFQTRPSADLVLYDFGAVLVTYSIPIEGSLQRLLELSDSLYDNARLLADSRARVERLLELIRDAVQRPSIADFVEDYLVFQIEALAKAVDLRDLGATHPQLLAQILRAEREALSDEEVRDALSHRISYGINDVAIIDWNAAILFDPNGDDVRAVLEFANVELLEMRYLDWRLDEALSQSYETLSTPKNKLLPMLGSAADMQQVGQWQVDSAILFEGVNNALKLLGDQYLARLYRLVSQRFHLAEWDASILRKIETLESIYEKMSDRVATRRLEVLEWIIIVLITVSIALPFLSGK